MGSVFMARFVSVEVEIGLIMGKGKSKLIVPTFALKLWWAGPEGAGRRRRSVVTSGRTQSESIRLDPSESDPPSLLSYGGQGRGQEIGGWFIRRWAQMGADGGLSNWGGRLIGLNPSRSERIRLDLGADDHEIQGNPG